MRAYEDPSRLGFRRRNSPLLRAQFGSLDGSLPGDAVKVPITPAKPAVRGRPEWWTEAFAGGPIL
jgi:hypothetical protein